MPLWSHGFATSQYGLTLLDLSLFKARFYADKMASEETQKKTRRTGDKCSFSFCSNRLKDNVSIRKPPKGPEIRKKRFNFVPKTQENVSKLNTVHVCSDHFTEDDYTINPSKFGLLASSETDVSFRRTLKRGVVPSIYPTPSEE